MRLKRLTFLLEIFLVICICSLIFCQYIHPLMYDENTASVSVKKPLVTAAVKYLDSLNDESKEDMIPVTAEEDVSEESVSLIRRQLTALPDDLISDFCNDGWQIIVTSDDLNEEYFDGEYTSVSGVTKYKEKEILVSDEEEAVLSAPMHEFGHWLDHEHEMISTSESFGEVLTEFKKVYDRTEYGYFPDDEGEYFADAVVFYFLTPDDLQQKCIQMYEFIDDCVQPD